MSRSLGSAIWQCKCPRCREGNMFVHSSRIQWYSVKMHKACPVCAQTYEPEPGFFYGAMYVSYGFSVALMTIAGTILYHFFDDPDMWVYFVVVSALVLILWPLMFRYSRSIFFHIFGGVRFDSELNKSE